MSCLISRRREAAGQEDLKLESLFVGGILRVLADRQTHPLAFVAPFQLTTTRKLLIV